MTCKKGLSICLFVLVLLSVLYYPSLHSPTLNQEEDSVLQLPVLSHAGNIPLIFSQDFLLFTQGQYRPLSYALISIFRTVVSPDNLLFWHLLLLGFHAINVMFVFALILQFAPRSSSAVIGATLFCLHPLCTVIVNDINQFHILLGITFSLGTLYCFSLFRKENRKIYYFLALFLCLLSLFTSRQGCTAPVILLCLEVFYYRTSFRKVGWIIPFLLMPVVLSPLLFMTSPHPLHYKYIEATKGSSWFSFYSVIGGSWIFLKGIIFTLSFPAVLHETVQRIFKASNPLFFISISIHLILLSGAIVGFYFRRWFYFGILVIYCSMFPYSTVYLNRVVEYVLWTYFYFAIAGLSIVFAGLYECCCQIEKIPVKKCFQILLIIPLLFWGYRTFELNKNISDPLTYWSGICDLGTNGTTASHRLGTWYLKKGDESQALLHLFTPSQDSLSESCLAMSRYYCRKGDYLASAIHLNYGSMEKPLGIVLEKQCLAAGELLLAVNVLDHADDNFGKVLMVNPFNTVALCKLAQVWFKKGFVNEGQEMLSQARKIFPNEPEIAKSEKIYMEAEQKYKDGIEKLDITPPSPSWLAYLVLNQKRLAIRQPIIDLSKKVNPNDPIIPLEAMITLIEENKFQEAAGYAKTVYNRLPKYSYAEAAVCEALAQSGEVDNAIQIGLKNVAQNTKSELAVRKLALAYALKGVTTLDSRFEKLLSTTPSLASLFYYNLGSYKISQNKNAEGAAWLEKAIQAAPSKPEIYIEYARSLIDSNDPTKAIEVLQKTIKVKKDSAEAYSLTGFALMATNKGKEGIAAFRKSIEIEPKNYMHHFYLGFSLKMDGKPEDALPELQRSVELKPDFMKSLYQLGVVSYQLKYYDRAASAFEAMLKLNPKLPEMYARLIDIYNAQGKPAEAQKIQERATQQGIKMAADDMTSQK